MGKRTRMTIGCDLGDKYSEIAVLNGRGTVVERLRIRTTSASLQKSMAARGPATVVIEVGMHSPWVSKLLADMGHEVIVANARKVKLIFAGKTKSDVVDAETLARLARVDRTLLAPIKHRDLRHQEYLTTIRARDSAVRSRTLLINSVRGLLKPFGLRVPSCSSAAFARRAADALPPELQQAILPLLDSIDVLSEAIKFHDDCIKDFAAEFPDIELLTQVVGVGELTAAAFILTISDPVRFPKSREVPAFFGLTPKKEQSGDSDPQRGITKAGDPYVRRLLVQCAHFIMGRYGGDSALRRFGLRLAERGGRNGKKHAVIATARKLAVLLHRLWTTGEIYEPLRGCEAPAPKA